MRVAARLGISKREAQARISSSEFTEWLAFEEHEFTSPSKEDHRIAKLACDLSFIIVKALTGESIDVKPADFLLKFRDLAVEAAERAKIDTLNMVGMSFMFGPPKKEE